jgi:hypothetical protein
MVALIPRPASADVLYSNLGPPGDQYYGGGYLIGTYYNTYVSADENQAIADQFTLGAGGTVADAVLPLFDLNSADSPVDLYIESDNLGVPGSIMASLLQVGTIGESAGLVTFTCSGSPCQLAANTYWLVAAQPDPLSLQAWNIQYQFAYGNVAYNNAGSATPPWNVYSGWEAAFQIDGTTSTVPEPTSILLFASVVLGIGIARRRSIGRG